MCCKQFCTWLVFFYLKSIFCCFCWLKRCCFVLLISNLHPGKLHFFCSSCRVRPLSESINDLFREVSLLHRRITELSHRLATLEPILRRLGYQGEDLEEAMGSRAQSLQGEATTLAQFDPRSKVRATPPRGSSRVVKRRRLRFLRNRGGKLIRDD